MTYTIMVDGVNVDSWPQWTALGLAYTDGAYANQVAAIARFPAIRLQTISVTGQVPAMWVDCEPGCVWPADHAVKVYASWRSQGCRGVYCAQSTKPAVRAAATAQGVSPEIFGADWTGQPHVVAGESQTQYFNCPSYDLTAIPAPDPPPDPPTPKPISKAVEMFLITLSDTGPVGEIHSTWLVTANGLANVLEPSVVALFPPAALVTNNQALLFTAKHGKV